MRTSPLLVLTLAMVLATDAWAAPQAGTVVLAEDLCQINRGQDQLKPHPGTRIEEGDVIKCIGRTRAKVFMGDVLVMFGPLSETTVVGSQPLTLKLAKGALRVISKPGTTSGFLVYTGRAKVAARQGDVFIRYNAASEFTEVVVFDGLATAENIGTGAAGKVTLRQLDSTLLSPDSVPTQPAAILQAEIATYARDTDLAAAPLPKGDIFAAIEPTMERVEETYGDARRRFARPSLPQNAPFRTLDSRRQAFALPAFDVPGRDTAPSSASILLDFTIEPPEPAALK